MDKPKENECCYCGTAIRLKPGGTVTILRGGCYDGGWLCQKCHNISTGHGLFIPLDLINGRQQQLIDEGFYDADL